MGCNLWSNRNLLHLVVSSVIEEFQDHLRKHSQCAERLFKHSYKCLPSNVWELGSSIPLLNSAELSTCCFYSFDFCCRYYCPDLLTHKWCMSACKHYILSPSLTWHELRTLSWLILTPVLNAYSVSFYISKSNEQAARLMQLFIGLTSNLLTKSLLAQCSPCGAKGFLSGSLVRRLRFSFSFPLRRLQTIWYMKVLQYFAAWKGAWTIKSAFILSMSNGIFIL